MIETGCRRTGFGRAPVILLATAAFAVLLSGCGAATKPRGAIGDATRGAVLVNREACGSCHAIPHIPRATGAVGPPLAGMGRRTIIAGYLPNTPDNMVLWLRAPQTIAPGNAMPNSGLSDRDARDIAAFLEELQ